MLEVIGRERAGNRRFGNERLQVLREHSDLGGLAVDVDDDQMRLPAARGFNRLAIRISVVNRPLAIGNPREGAAQLLLERGVGADDEDLQGLVGVAGIKPHDGYRTSTGTSTGP